MYKQIFYRRILTYTLGTLFALAPLAHGIPRNMNDALPVFLVVAACLLLAAASFAGALGRPLRLRLNWTDLWIALYLFYAVSREIVAPSSFMESVSRIEWIGLVIVYLLCRNLPAEERSRLPLFVVAGGVIQAVLGLLQWGKLVPSGNGLFPVTGSFSNPGPYGGYLAIAAVCALSAWKRQNFAFHGKALGLPLALLLILPALVLSDSRAAWLAFLLPCGYGFLLGKKRGWQLAAVAVLVVVVALLYLYKKPSADARLLAWQSSFGMVEERPLFGHGSGGFAANYMPCQAEFLDRHPDTSYSLAADNNILAFNDWLRLLCEQGIAGGVLFLLLVGSAFRCSGDDSAGFARQGLAAWCVFAFFSYPASVFALKMCFPLFLGCLAAGLRTVWECTLSRLVRVSALGILAVGAWLSVETYTEYHSAYQNLHVGSYRQGNIAPLLTDAVPVSRDKYFLYMLSEQLIDANRLPEALRVKLRLADIAPSSSLHGDIGMLYLDSHRLDSAAAHFETARRMTPNHITPTYGLFLVARQRADSLRCLRLARTILRMPVRITNNRVLKARHEAKAFINQYENQVLTKNN